MKRTLSLKPSGFTLVELLVVIAIIGLLVAIVVPNLSNAKALGRDSRRVSDIKNIQLALSLYYNDNQQYPNSLASLVPNYMSAVPKDPITNANYRYSAMNATYTSNCTGNNLPSRYQLAAVMERMSGSSLPGDDIDFNISTNNYCTGTDWTTKYNGAATDCTGTTAGNDNCYDVVNN